MLKLELNIVSRFETSKLTRFLFLKESMQSISMSKNYLVEQNLISDRVYALTYTLNLSKQAFRHAICFQNNTITIPKNAVSTVFLLQDNSFQGKPVLLTCISVEQYYHLIITATTMAGLQSSREKEEK